MKKRAELEKEMKLKEIGIYIPKHYKNQGKFASLEVHGE